MILIRFIKVIYSLAAKSSGAFSVLLFNYWLSVVYSIDFVGKVLLCVTVVHVLGMLSTLGQGNSALKYIASNIDDDFKVSSIVSYSIRRIVLSAILFSVCICSLSSFLSDKVFMMEGLSPLLKVFSLAIPFYAVNSFLASVYVAKGRAIESSLFQTSIPYLICILISIILNRVFAEGEIFVIFFSFPLAFLMATLISIIGLVKNGVCLKRGVNKELFIQHKRASNYFLLILAMNLFMQWGIQILSAMYLTPEDVGVLNICYRISNSLTLVLAAVTAISSPVFAHSYKAKGGEALLDQVQYYNTALYIFSIAAMFLLLVFGGFFLSIFSISEDDGIYVLRVLVLGQGFSVLSGSVGYILAMTGHEKDLMFGMFMATIISLLVCVFFSSNYGVVGAALSISFAVIFNNILLIFAIKKRLGFYPLGFRYKK